VARRYLGGRTRESLPGADDPAGPLREHRNRPMRIPRARQSPTAPPLLASFAAYTLGMVAMVVWVARDDSPWILALAAVVLLGLVAMLLRTLGACSAAASRRSRTDAPSVADIPPHRPPCGDRPAPRRVTIVRGPLRRSNRQCGAD
jgi:hypothetical protein